MSTSSLIREYWKFPGHNSNIQGMKSQENLNSHRKIQSPDAHTEMAQMLELSDMEFKYSSKQL